MELGLGPTMTSQFVVRLLVTAGVLTYDRTNDSENVLFGRVQQMIGAIFTILQAIFHVVAGMYGPLSTLGMMNAILIVVQLCASSIIM